MRIHKVQLENINSIKGRWSIDFDDPEYERSPLFAICGPTGAGKTTLLDAICLALFGRTPRQDRVNKSVDEVLTRGEKSASASVTFSAGGNLFRAEWRHRKTRNDTWQDVKVSLEERKEDGWTHLAESVKPREEMMKTKFGLDFDQFTRSILLAQGSFSAFMKCKPEERATLLEKITGSNIYTEISKESHARKKAAAENLARKQEALGNIPVLEPEAKLVLENESAVLEKGLEERGARIKALKADLDWLVKVAESEKALERFEREAAEAKRNKEEGAFLQTDLERAEKGALIQGSFDALQKIRKDLADQKMKLAENSKFLQEVLEKKEALQKEHLKSEDALAFAKDEERKLLKILPEVRVLDNRIEAEKKEKARLASDKKAWEGKRNSAQADMAKYSADLAKLTVQKDQLEQWLLENKNDGKLNAALSGFKAKLGVFRDRQKQREEAEEMLKSGAEALRTLESDFAKKEKEHLEEADKLKKLAENKAGFSTELQQVLQGKVLETWQEERLDGHALATRLSDLLKKVAELETTEAECEKLRIASVDAEKSLGEVTEALDRKNQRAGEIEKRLKELEGLRKAKDIVEQLSELRHNLKPGEKCPLCGSENHPYCEELPEIPYDLQEEKTLETEQRTLNLDIKRTERKKSTLQGTLDALAEDILRKEKTRVSASEGVRQLSETLGVKASAEEIQKRIQEEREKESERNKVITLAKTLALDLAKVEERLEEAKTREALLQTTLATLGADKDNAQRRLQEQTALWEDSVKKEEAAGNDFARDVESFIGQEDALADPEGLMEELGRRNTAYQTRSGSLDPLRQKITKTGADLEGAQKSFKEYEDSYKTSSESYDKTSEQAAALMGTRAELFGIRNPDEAQEEARRGIQTAEALLKAIEEKLGKVREEESVLSGKKTTLESQVISSEAGEKEARAQWSLKLAEQGFSNEAEWQNAQKSPKEKQAIRERINALEKALSEKEGQVKSQKQALEALRAENKTEKAQAELEGELKVEEENRNTSQIRLGEVRQQLRTNTDNENKRKEFQGELEKLEKENERWSLLHTLIGSEDGKKFRNFVQMFTFQSLVEQANLTLEKISDRYELQISDKNGLDLSVADHYQAGVVRPVSNLSGGESFLVSLALALGLSKMASRNVRIDSLFLDEGFGTLDEDSLVNALDVLAGLNTEGKRIGIISHVGQIRDKIPAKIEVIKRAGGFSTLKGPGVTSGF